MGPLDQLGVDASSRRGGRPRTRPRPPRPAPGRGRRRSPRARRGPGGRRRPAPPAAWRTWNDDTMTRSVQPASSIAAAVSAATASPGSHPGSWGAFLISTLTTMPSQTARTSARRGTCGGQVRHAQSRRSRRGPGSRRRGGRPGPVGGQAHVELDPVGPEPPGLGEGVEGVLDEALGATPMSEDGGHRDGVTPMSRIQRPTARKFHENSLPALAAGRYPLLR